MKTLIILIISLISFSITRAQTDTWTQKASFGGIARSEAVSFTIGDKAYVGLGALSIPEGVEFWEYDPIADVWTQKADFDGIERRHAVAFSIDNIGYVGTGLFFNAICLKDFYAYDPVYNSWTQKSDFGGPECAGAVAFSLNGKGYVGTGYTLENSQRQDLQSFWEYDPTNDNWTQVSNFGGDPRSYAVAFCINGYGFVGTGNHNSNNYQDFWRYDPQNDSWMAANSFPGNARSQAVGFAIGQKGYIGTGFSSYNNYLSDFWEFDGNNWIQRADFGGGQRFDAVGYSIGGYGYLGTGIGPSNNGTRDVWQYSPASCLKTLTASSGSNGSISPSGSTSNNCGSNQTYTVTPNPGYVIADVLVDNVSVGAVSSYTFSDIQTDHTISATFATTSHVTLSLSNCTSTTPNTFEFDLYVLNDGTSSLKLNALAFGVNVNTAILTNSSDNLSMSYVGGSELPAAISNSFAFNYSSSIHQLRLTSSSLALPYASAPTIPNGTPVKVGRFRVTNNSHNWVTASTTNLSLNTATGGFNTNTGATVYIGSNTTTTAFNNSANRDVQTDCSITLNCTPVIACPSNITVNNDAGICGAVVTFTDPEVSGCPGVTLTQTAGLSSGATFPVGNTTNTFQATDPSGNFSACSFTVTVNDNEAPAVPVLATVNGECSASVSAPTTTDNCAGIVTGTTTDPLTYTSQGTFTVHWTFDDGNGNTSTADQTVIVDDVTPPVVPTLATVTGECSASATAPTTTDNCSGTITGTTTDAVSYNAQGIYTIHWTFDDGNGNTSTADQTVVVDDVTPPVAPTLATVTGECSASVGAPTTTDNCSGTITGTTTDALSYSTQGTFTVHWTFDDGNGNISTADQTVIVDDVTPPSISCPADIIVQANSGGCTATGVSLGTATGSDNCGAVTFSNDAPSGFPLGNTTVTWTADDGHGNTSTCTQTVTVTNPASVSLNETDNSGVVADDGILCAGIGGATLTASGAISYTWSPETGLSATTGASVTATPTVTTTYTVTGTTAIGCVATATVTITVETCTSDLALKFFIQGYYDGGGMMKSVLHKQEVDPNPSSTNVDTVVIELHPSATPSDVEASFKGVLQTDGTLSCSFPSSVIGHAYYIVIKHRSALQTWSANPVVFSYNNSYDFTDAASKTYWNNTIEVESGVWAIYNGDINQDESIDIFDVPELDFDIQNNAFGYFRSDLDGTGMPAAYDWFILDTNSQNFVGSIHP